MSGENSHPFSDNILAVADVYYDSDCAYERVAAIFIHPWALFRYRLKFTLKALNNTAMGRGRELGGCQFV